MTLLFTLNQKITNKHQNQTMRINPLVCADAYKLSHRGFMNPLTEIIYSNLTPRTLKYLPIPKELHTDKAAFFGLQVFIKDFLINDWNDLFFSQPKEKVIAKFKRRCDTFLGPGSVSMEHFEELHDLQYLPISIKALPEGSLVNEKVPFLTIQNTNPKFAWLTNYLETILSCEIWKPCYTATLTAGYKKLVNKFADETVGNKNHTLFQLHGFEFRGMSGRYDAAIAGAGLLLNSCGTDTMPAIDVLEDFYNANAENELIAASVPASEHAVSSLGTSLQGELEFFREAITKHYPTGIVSLVADTYDFFRVVTEYAQELKNDILNRKVNAIGLAKVVFRPDSGNPVKIVCGWKVKYENDYVLKSSLDDVFEIEKHDAITFDNGKTVNEIVWTGSEHVLGRELESPEIKGAVECLWDVFGGTESEKGYKVLNERTGLIYGDSCTFQVINNILQRLKEKGFASSNILFGVGSFSMQYCTRDSLGMAQKATWAQVDGKGYDLFKEPKTDGPAGFKKSAKGLLRVDLIDGEYVLKDQCTPEEEAGGELKEVFRDGKLLKDFTLSEVRANLAAYL